MRTEGDTFLNEGLLRKGMSIPSDQLEAFREALDRAARPLFFFDGDADGLTAFTLLYKYKKEGRGVMISGRPQLNEDFLRKYEAYQPDVVFILDTAQVTQEFIDGVRCPIYWLDHHEPQQGSLQLPKRVHYLNPRLENPDDGRPTAFWAYQIARQEENIWIAMVGIIGDYFFDEFLAERLRERFPEYLSRKITHQGEALFDSPLGTLIRVMNFNLKGAVSDSMTSVKIFTRIEHPDEILHQESPRGRYLWKRYLRVMKHYERLFAEAEQQIDAKDPFIVFVYQNEVFSLSSELANELKYRHKEKVVVVGRRHEGKVMMSLRSEVVPILPSLQKALGEVEGYGGGHPRACGAVVAEKDFDRFIKLFREAFSSFERTFRIEEKEEP